LKPQKIENEIVAVIITALQMQKTSLSTCRKKNISSCVDNSLSHLEENVKENKMKNEDNNDYIETLQAEINTPYKKSMIFYESWLGIVNALSTDKEKLDFLLNVIDYGLYAEFTKKDMSAKLQAIIAPLIPLINQDRNRYKNRIKGTIKRITKKQAKEQEKEDKEDVWGVLLDKQVNANRQRKIK